MAYQQIAYLAVNKEVQQQLQIIKTLVHGFHASVNLQNNQEKSGLSSPSSNRKPAATAIPAATGPEPQAWKAPTARHWGSGG